MIKKSKMLSFIVVEIILFPMIFPISWLPYFLVYSDMIACEFF